MALTASAPPTVEDKIVNSLCLCDPVKVKLDLNRPNIYISTIKGTALMVCWKDLNNLADQLSSCRNPLQFPKTIIFVKTKSVTVKVFAYLHRFSPQKVKGKLSELSTYSHVVAVGGKFRIYFRKCISETDGGCVPLSLWTTLHGTLIPYPSDGH